jgi:acetolactate synthase I/II/III large subunit
MGMTASQYIVDFLVRRGVPYVVGIPGHGNLTFVDALTERAAELPMRMVRHEQSAVHFADGFYRVTDQPLVVTTSVGPGAVNTLVGMATAMADSIPVVLITGNVQTYFLERGAIQDVSFRQASDFANMVRPVVKRSWSVMHAADLPDVLQRAFREATTGRPGPVHIEIPMDIQAAEIEPPGAPPSDYDVPFKAFPDPASIEGAADVLLSAERPVLLAGGGVIMAHAEETLRELAEYLGVPVITTLTSKGVIPEDHPLNAFYTGPKGSTCGVNVTRSADVFLAVGFRFSEWASGSYRPGEVFSIPPQRVIQIDVDPAEIGRNYPVVAPILADAGHALRSLLEAVKRRTPRREYEASAAYGELQAWRSEWLDKVTHQTARDAQPMTMSRALAEIRKALPRDAIVVTSSGHSQGIVYQEFPIYEPRTHISAGGFSTMGWSFPAALGIKSALPGRVVATLIGDGDFLMTCQELAMAMQYGIPVLNCVLNNSGYLSIRDMQASIFGEDRTIATESALPDGTPYSPDLAALAESFGAYGARVDDADALAEAVRAALSSGRPAVLDIRVASAYPKSGNELGAWAEFPKPSLVGAG